MQQQLPPDDGSEDDRIHCKSGQVATGVAATTTGEMTKLHNKDVERPVKIPSQGMNLTWMEEITFLLCSCF